MFHVAKRKQQHRLLPEFTWSSTRLGRSSIGLKESEFLTMQPLVSEAPFSSTSIGRTETSLSLTSYQTLAVIALLSFLSATPGSHRASWSSSLSFSVR